VHVLGVVVRVVEVDDALVVGLHNVLRQQDAVRDVAADLAGHIVALRRVDNGVLVGVLLLGLLVVALDERENLVVGGVGLAHECAGIAIGDVVLGHLKGTVGHDVVLDHVLNFLDGRCAVHLLALQFHGLSDPLDLHGRHAVGLLDGLVGLRDGDDDLRNIEHDLGTISLHDFHRSISSSFPSVFP